MGYFKSAQYARRQKVQEEQPQLFTHSLERQVSALYGLIHQAAQSVGVGCAAPYLGRLWNAVLCASNLQAGFLQVPVDTARAANGMTWLGFNLRKLGVEMANAANYASLTIDASLARNLIAVGYSAETFLSDWRKLRDFEEILAAVNPRLIDTSGLVAATGAVDNLVLQDIISQDKLPISRGGQMRQDG